MAFYEENPQSVTKADVIVGIPTFNEAGNIAQTTEQVDRGLSEYFPGMECVIINCDNHSTDGTREAFFAAAGKVPRIYLSSPPEERGKGVNLRNFFTKSKQLSPKALITVEADVRNIAAHWIRDLGMPIIKGAGYVCPLYVRHKYEATLTSSFLYPLLRCLYGRRVRQPNVGDFGFSPKMLDIFLEAPFVNEHIGNYGIDIWMTNIALASRVPIVQAFMGAPKVHRLKDPDEHLRTLFREVLSTIFELMKVYKSFWEQVKWSKPTALSGTDLYEVETPLPVEIDAAKLHRQFLAGFDRYYGLWEKVYGPTIVPKLQEIRSMGLQHFAFPTQTWATIMFDSAAAYQRMDQAARNEMLDALLPLHLGKVLSFVKKTERMSLQQAEDYVETECAIFEENKPYIVKVWD
ncbi:MAG: glycosyltransferase [Desulfobacteraceae bacterium]|nr:glycosyltransferase [Desulfobacteraceae bacterium]